MDEQNSGDINEIKRALESASAKKRALLDALNDVKKKLDEKRRQKEIAEIKRVRKNLDTL